MVEMVCQLIGIFAIGGLILQIFSLSDIHRLESIMRKQRSIGQKWYLRSLKINILITLALFGAIFFLPILCYLLST